MSLDLKPYSELVLADVTQALESITELTQEENPELDLRFGPIQNLVLYVSALHHSSLNDLIEQYRISSSLNLINENPELATDEIVDNVLSNRGLTRRAGSKATGTITIIVSQLITTTIAKGTVFTANGVEFVATAAYTARINSENVIEENDRVLTPYGSNYSFTIEVEAVEEGADGMLRKDTLLVPSSLIANFVKSFATSDFTGGQDTETNTELLAREAEGMAASTMSNRATMAALLASEFPGVIAKSIIGFGDAEMQRDRHSLWPMSGGGRCDWYVRTSELPQKLGLLMTATLMEKTSDGFGYWQLNFLRDDAPGFYDVFSIAPEDVSEFIGSFPISLNQRSVDLSSLADELLPDIATAVEATYTRFQTATIRFKDTETNTDSLSLGATRSYNVTVRALPDLADIQSFMGSRRTRYYGGDVLIRAAVPCFCSLSFMLEGKPGATLPDPYAVQQAIAQYVNTLGFAGRLHASAISDIVHDFLPAGVNMANIDLYGQILRPDGTVKTLRSPDVLVVPDESDSMVTARTVCFFMDPEDIRISAQTVNVPEVL